MNTKTYAVVDLETTGHSSQKGDRMIQIAIVLVKDGIVKERYTRFVNPGQKIPPFIRELTNIYDDDVKNAPTFEKIAKEVRELLEDTIFVAHNTAFDLPFLQSEFARCGIPKWSGQEVDTVELSKIVFPSLPSYRLQDIAEALTIPLPAAHRADDDAAATSELLARCIEKLHTLPVETLALLHRKSFKLKSDLAGLFYAVLKEIRDKKTTGDYDLFRGIPYKKYAAAKPMSTERAIYPKDEQTKIAYLKKAFPKFEKRSAQFEFMDTVQKALHEREEVAVEVPTGIGKTVAYLLPAAIHAIEQQKPVVISTYTNYLVDKIVSSEIEKISETIQMPLTSAVLKGKDHYISLRKFEELLTLPEQSYDETFTMMQILVWLTETSTGDLGELTATGGGQLFIDRIRSRASQLTAEERAADYFTKHLATAKHAHFIITNHAMLLADVQRKTPIFDGIAGLIVDEAHQFTHTAAKFKETVFSYTNWKYVMGQLGSNGEDQLLPAILSLAVRFGESASLEEKLSVKFDRFSTCFDEVSNRLAYYELSRDRRRENRRQYVLQTVTSETRQFEAVLTAMHQYLDEAEAVGRKLAVHLSDLAKSEQTLVKEWAYWVRELKIKASEWVELFLERDDDFTVWIERDQRSLPSSLTAIRHPLDSSAVIQNLTEKLKEQAIGIVWTSGTMAIGDKKKYIPEQLGLAETVPLHVFDAPENFYDGANMYIISDMPNIQQVSQADYIAEVAHTVVQAAMATGGRLFVLFTSKDMLRKTYDLIIDSEQLEEYALFAQGITGGSRMKLLKSFHQYNQSVLFGTSSFWEGVDVPGDALAAVIVVRLPFTSPEDPIYKAKAKKLALHGKNAFEEYALPEAVMRIRQGFGRLIRSSKDKGAFIILDRRIETKSYGVQFTKALPNITIKNVPVEVMVQELENCYNKPTEEK